MFRSCLIISLWKGGHKPPKIDNVIFEDKALSHAMVSVMTMFALALKVFVGSSRAGIAAKTNFVAQVVFAITDDHIHTMSSWLL